MRAPRHPALSPRRTQPRGLTGRQLDLMDQLEKLFLSEGFSHHTLDGIVNTLRCSKMTLYTLAPSREQLTLTVLKRYFEDADRRIELAARKASTPDHRIRACLRACVDEMSAMTPRCFSDVLAFETTRDIYDTFSQANFDRLQDIVEEKSVGRQISAKRSTFLAAISAITLHEIYTGDLLHETQLSADDSVEFLIETVLASAGQSGRTARGIKRLK
jgi:AcrR family transcriptional regulator